MREDDDISVIPVTLTVKGVLPADMFELYLGGGIGWYFVSFDGDATISGTVLDVPFQSSLSFDDDDNVFGGHVVVGAVINFSEVFFFGVEGKHIWTGEADFSGTAQFVIDSTTIPVPIDIEANVNGYTVTGVLGFKF
jgi:hypothetical protein